MPGFHEINLIPTEILTQRMIRQRIRKWSILLLCQIICFCLLGTSFYGYLKRLESQADTLRRRTRQTKQIENRLLLAYQEVKELLQKRQVLLGRSQNQCLAPVLFNLAEALDPHTKLSSLQIEREIVNTPQKEIQNYYSLKLSGISRSYQNLSTFLLNLQQNQSFQQIRLIRSDGHEQQSPWVSFEIALIYKQQAGQNQAGAEKVLYQKGAYHATESTPD